MERVYYPNTRRVIFFNYLLLPIGWLLGFSVRAIVDLINDIPIAHLNWVSFITACLTWMGLNIFIKGLSGQRLAIKITPSAISGPIAVGRDEPIPVNLIDFEKTHKKKQIWSIRGDQISFDSNLFDPKDVSEIWGIIDEFENSKDKL